MTAGIGGALTALRAGSAVVVPNPPPLTHVVTATDPAVVNLAKARPASQPVAVWITTDALWSELAATLPLDHAAADLARRLLVDEMVTLLVPVDENRYPHWLAPAVHDGHALLFGARWTPLRDLLTDIGLLYVSSANRTGTPPVATAAHARTVFGPTVPVIEVSDSAQPGMARRATTTIHLHRDRTLSLTREGAQDFAHGGPEHYLDYLRDRDVDLTT
ncbi:Sua5/YciO/YrdC/YwlC family protein [Amycolatopsis pithecellobii]|uniref:Sua5/YciO/YrdC/YwlC family protein n=1 Tax=Amycolatopsis pithecellobii TaxID=664692 RepID=UPI0012B926EC|nr:Sua5/YciO/YrdC/YwlC family protein [Amycolatopsis pithecellobii]